MAMELASGYVEISERGLTSVQRKVTSLGSSFSSVLKGPFTAFQSAFNGLSKLGFAFQGIQGVAQGLGTLNPLPMIQLAASAEQTEIAFTTMLGSLDNAKSLIGDLNQFANITPFDNREVINSAKTLLAMGVELNNVMPLLKNIGDVSSGVSTDLGGVALILGQVKAAGRLMTQDLLQMTTRGIPILDALAAQYSAFADPNDGDGVTASEVRKMVEEGKVSFEDTVKAFDRMAGAGGKFENMMEKQSKSVSGLWSTFAGQMSFVGMEVGKVLIEAFNISDGLTSLNAGLASIIPKVREYIMPVADAIRPVIGAIGNVFQAIFDNTTILGKQIQNIGHGFYLWGEIFSGLYTQIGNALSSLGILFGSFFESTSTGASMTFGSMVDAASSWTFAFFDAIRSVVQNLDLAFPLMIERIKLFGVNAVEYMRVFAVNSGKWISWFSQNWRDVFTDIFNFSKTVFTNLTSNLVTLFSKIWEWVSNGFQGDLNLDWKPLTTGFESAIKEWPDLAEAQIIKTNDKIESLTEEWGNREAIRAQKISEQKAKNSIGSVVAAQSGLSIPQYNFGDSSQGPKLPSSLGSSTANQSNKASSAVNSAILSNTSAGMNSALSALQNAGASLQKEANNHLKKIETATISTAKAIENLAKKPATSQASLKLAEGI